MLLAYVDESHGALRYWVAALICPEDALLPLVRALDGVVEGTSRAYPGISPGPNSTATRSFMASTIGHR